MIEELETRVSFIHKLIEDEINSGNVHEVLLQRYEGREEAYWDVIQMIKEIKNCE